MQSLSQHVLYSLQHTKLCCEGSQRVYVEHKAATRRFAVVTAVAGKGLMCTATVRTWLALGR